MGLTVVRGGAHAKEAAAHDIRQNIRRLAIALTAASRHFPRSRPWFGLLVRLLLWWENALSGQRW